MGIRASMTRMRAHQGGVLERLDAVRARIAAAGGDPAGITVVAAKPPDPQAAAAARDAGVADLGENFAQLLVDKATAVTGVRWHFIGPVQRNKVRPLAPHVHLWQAIDRVSAGEEVARRAPAARVLVQVNTSGEPAKHGCAPEATGELVDALRGHGLDVQGLMTMGPLGAPEQAREGFRWLRREVDRLGLAVCSMGMSDDLEVAVQEGTTMVRVGRALFGPR